MLRAEKKLSESLIHVSVLAHLRQRHEQLHGEEEKGVKRQTASKRIQKSWCEARHTTDRNFLFSLLYDALLASSQNQLVRRAAQHGIHKDIRCNIIPHGKQYCGHGRTTCCCGAGVQTLRQISVACAAAGGHFCGRREKNQSPRARRHLTARVLIGPTAGELGGRAARPLCQQDGRRRSRSRCGCLLLFPCCCAAPHSRVRFPGVRTHHGEHFSWPRQ